MSLDVKELGRRLKTEREARSLSVDAIAKQAAVSTSYLEKLERGELSEAALESLDALARALAVPLLHLLADARPPQTREEVAAQRERQAAAFLAGLPTSLRAFVEEERAAGRTVAEDALKALAHVEFQQAAPTEPDGWRRMLHTMLHGLHPAP